MNRTLLSRLFAVVVVAFLLPAPALANGVANAHASSQLKSDTKPALYQALNVLDGNPATAWCEGVDGDGVGETIVVGFKGIGTIDEVRITTGEAKDAASFKAHGRVRQLDLKTDEKRHSFSVVDNTTPQSFKFDPVETELLTLEVVEVAPGEGDEKATCLADVIFLSKGKPINGTFLESKLRYDKGRTALMGRWYGGPEGARDKFLDFDFDGTYRYSFRPFDPEVKPVNFSGKYAFDGDRLRLEVPGKGWADVRTAPRATRDDAAVLELEGKVIEKTLAGKWTNRK